jgi:DNA-binding LytR/AlgR family response regulator
MNGAVGVTKRLSPVARALLVIAAFVLLVTTFDIFTAIHDAAEHGSALAAWEPATWEYTSGVATLACCAIVYWAVRLAPPGRTGWLRFAAIHVVASFAFSALHILLMNAMRVFIYAALDRYYQFGEAGFWYEYRKDLIAYVICAAIFWFFTREAATQAASTTRRIVDIRDGKRLLRVPIEEIAAIHAAGNYVEFLLLDDRRPLARQSLSMAQRELGDDFVRTHRSWAINAAHVRMLRVTGAGDYEIELSGGVKAPLSRRFPDALARLRTPEPRT